MNNTDFFNSHRAEALKMIAENVHHEGIWEVIKNPTLGYVCADKTTGWATIYDPCANTTEGKAQWLDLIVEHRNMLTHGGVCASDAFAFFNDVSDQESTCIAYLDMIRKV